LLKTDSTVVPPKYAASATEVAQAMPPAAFHRTNVGQRIELAPASHEAHTRSPAIQRPRNTAFGPWRAKNGSPSARTFWRSS